MQRAWRERRSRWGRWCLALTAMASGMVLPLQTQLPWYSLLLWPPFALCCAPVMAALVDGTLPVRLQRGIGRIWLLLGLALVGTAGLSVLITTLPITLTLATPGGVGLLAGGLVLGQPATRLRQRQRAARALLMGWCVSLLLLFSTALWNWELNESPSIVPLQTLVSRSSRAGALAGLPLVVDGAIGNRPSLRWYAEAPLGKPRKRETLQRWQASGGLLLVSRADAPEQSEWARKLGIDRINSQSCRLERRGEHGWRRWLCSFARPSQP
jgi:hypothetical protein